MHRFLFTSLALFLLPLPAQAAEPVTGWGGLLLGMSVEEAKAARPEFDWADEDFVKCLYQPKTCTLYTWEQHEVKIGKLTLDPSFHFDSGGRLEKILLSRTFPFIRIAPIIEDDTSSVSRTECHEMFRYLLEPLERKYGLMTDTDPEAVISSPPEKLHTTPLGGRYRHPSDKGLPPGNYWVSVTTNVEASQQSSKHISPFKAHAGLSMIWDRGEGSCFLSISYKQGFAPPDGAISAMEDQL
ncbi:hypothetical protein ACSHT0_16965 [Tepidicaulis sp. LMO-SS28]|uniref:hypothetical protein n=1 Tax=Tepidicaulis sp. LMO-SS28 TaxID=3447455 RepID=UPI003EE1A290